MAQDLLPQIFARLVMAILAGLLVGLGAYVACPRDRLTEFGELLGNASYSIYLFHPHFESAQLAIMAKLTPWMPVFGVVMLVTLGATVGSIIVYFFVEIPLVSYAQSHLKRRQRAEAIKQPSQSPFL